MILRKFLTHPGKQWLYAIVIACLGLLVYTAVLTFGIPSTIKQVFSFPEAPFLYSATLAFFYLAYRLPGWLGTLTSFSATLLVFATQLAGVWQSARSDNFVLFGGLLPVSDASGYYGGALQILEGHHISGYLSWRPLFSGVLATLLGLTQHNLQATLALLVLINATACFFLARELQRSHGTVAGVVTLATLFMFYRQFIGTTMTENLGLALGAVGLALLWRGMVDQQRHRCLLGLLLLTLALNARAGTFLILPALIIWGTRSFRGASRFSRHFLVGGVGLVLLGFMANALVSKTIRDPSTMANANFAYSLYGLIMGGNWETIFTDHPEVNQLSDIQRTQRIYALIFEVLRANPLAFVRACWRAWTYFLESKFIFSFVQNETLHFILNCLSLVALVASYFWRRMPIGSFIIASTIGILLSTPFVPPWDAGMRPYAATLPFLALLPALGLIFLTQKMQRHPLPQVPQQHNPPSALLLFTFSLICLSIGGPIVTIIVARSWHHHPHFVDLVCPDGTEAAYFHQSPGSSIHLVANNELEETNIPDLRFDDFQSQLYQYNLLYAWIREIPVLSKELMSLPPDTTLMSKLDLKRRYLLWIIAKKTLFPKENGFIGVCGKTPNTELTRRHGFSLFYADSMYLLKKSAAGHLQWSPEQPAAPKQVSLGGALPTQQAVTPFMLTISPPSGTYIMSQVFDFAVILHAPRLTIVGGVILIDGVDKTADFTRGVVSGTLAVRGGTTFRYRSLSNTMIGRGTHRVDVCIQLSDGAQVCDSVLWKILENTEP